MRLTRYEIDAIKNCFTQVFSAGQIYLFGSRTDDTEKGGDIDLYLKLNDATNWHEKNKVLVNLKSKIGDQKIDVIISKDVNSVIEQEAVLTGILL